MHKERRIPCGIRPSVGGTGQPCLVLRKTELELPGAEDQGEAYKGAELKHITLFLSSALGTKE